MTAKDVIHSAARVLMVDKQATDLLAAFRYVNTFDTLDLAKQASQVEYGITPVFATDNRAYYTVVLAVGHDQFKGLGVNGVIIVNSIISCIGAQLCV